MPNDRLGGQGALVPGEMCRSQRRSRWWACQSHFLVRVSEWPRVSESMLGHQKSNGHGCHNLLPWTGSGEALLPSPKWVPSPGTNDTGICGKIPGRSNDNFLIRRWGKMQTNQNTDSMRNTERRHKKRQRTQILIEGGRTWRKRLTEETRVNRGKLWERKGNAQQWDRTHASYERGKPREDEKARGFNYREHIKMK